MLTVANRSLPRFNGSACIGTFVSLHGGNGSESALYCSASLFAARVT